MLAYLLRALKEETIDRDMLIFQQQELKVDKIIPEDFINRLEKMTEPRKQIFLVFVHVIVCRPIIEPNRGFLVQLWNLATSLFPPTN